MWCWCCVCTCGVVLCVYMWCVVKLGTRKTPPSPHVYVQNASVCRVRTSPCVPATGPHVEDMRACCRCTRRRPDRAHGGVLNGHTGGFLFSLSLALSRSFLPLFSLLFSSQDHGRLSIVLWCVVCCVLCVVWVHEGVVLCDELCDELFGVLRGGGVVWCVVCGCFISLFLSFSFSQFSFSSFSLSLFLVFSFFCLVFLFLFSLPSRQQTLCKALINKRDVQL